MPEVRETPTRTLIVALVVSLVCALLVSVTAVLLRPLQVANREQERQAQILDIVAKLPGIEDLFETLEVAAVESQVVELATGSYVPSIDPQEYDQGLAAADPQQSVAIPPGRDIASIERRARYATVHLVKKENRIELLILPVHGSGYASTLRGYLALAGDADTVVALSFFEHAETPGIGARVDDPEWKNQWQGKKVRDAQGQIRLGVASGSVDQSTPEAAFLVDGITGATRTASGVTNLVRFWLGEDGFGPYLQRIRAQEE